jgi:TldD protein
METNAITIAKATLLDAHDITQSQLQNTLGSMLSGVSDAADIYLQTRHCAGWFLEEGLVKEGSFHHAQGVGLRAMSGEKTGFAFTEDLNIKSLHQAAQAAKSIAQCGQVRHGQALQPRHHTPFYLPHNPIATFSDQEKIALLQRVDQYLRQKDPRVKQVMLNITGSHEVILLAHSDGSLGGDVRPMVKFTVQVIVEQKGRSESGFAGGGGRYAYQYFIEEERALKYADEALRIALVNLDAQDAPAGSMPVVLGSGWPGVLLHEAVGHGLEGDFNRKKTSIFSDRIGQQVASPLCSVIDDGTMPGRRGSLNIDDEGILTKRNVLIEKGILKGYMQDKHNAKLMGVAPTGNGRRESYAHLPMPRMTNTYMLAGEHDPKDIIKSVKKGIYAPHFAGGQVDITSGKFVFTSSEAYLIENGEITSPIKGATLIGSGPEAMKNVSMVGNDLQLDAGVGVCGKDGQSVPVGVGQPTLKIDEMTIGGTQ